MKYFIALFCVLLFSACGGGGGESSLITTVTGPIKSQSLVASTAANTAVLHLYQAIDGIAPNNAALKAATEQIGDGNGFAWANAASPDASRISDSDLAIRVLNNIGITNTSLIATASFGTSQQAYDALRKALADYFFATGPANRGTVILQLTQIISKFEGETTFGVYGNAATVFNRQVALNATYSSNPSNIVNAIVPTAIANAGTDQKVVAGVAVKLDGSASKVDFGKNLTYFWTLKTKPAGSSAALTSAVVVNPSFTPDMAGTYIASLIVNDGRASSSAVTVTIVAAAPNSAPVANIVAPSSYSIGGTLVLSAAGSQDRDGDALTYLWSFTAPAANSALLYGYTTATASVTPTIPGTYTFSLIVNDGKLNSNVATVSVVVTASTAVNIAPKAVLSAPANSVQGSVLTLNANSSSDANGDPLTYSWYLVSSPVGSSAVLNNPTSAQTTITPTVAGLYSFLVIVSDGKLISNASVIVTVSSANIAPVSVASAPSSIAAGNVLTLSGAGSSDANGDPLTYLWSLVSAPAGSFVFLNSPFSALTSITPTVAGTYTFSLVVNDGKVYSSVSTVSVLVSPSVVVPPVNIAPVAVASAPSSVTAGSVLTLSGTGSSDANGDALTYLWNLISAPAGNLAFLSSPTSDRPTLTPMVAGNYLFALVVNDGKVNSDAVFVSVLVKVDGGTQDDCYSTSILSPSSFAGNYGDIVKLKDGSYWEVTGFYQYSDAPYSAVTICPISGGLTANGKTMNVRRLQGVVESTIDGDSEGWNGASRITLTNGQIWLQREFYYAYRYWFRPSVLIYQNGGRYFMRIDGIDRSVEVIRGN